MTLAVRVPSPLRAVIFDLDGLLIDSEPHWRAVEMEVFGEVGLRLDEAACAQTTGLRIDEVVALRFAERPWAGPSVTEVTERVIARMIERLGRLGEAKQGALEAVAFVRARGVRVGLASSSARRIIDAALGRLGLDGGFDAVGSAEGQRWGKPHPGVYLAMADALAVPPTECLAIEDSLNGVIAAKAARMRCLAVPDGHAQGDPRFVLADAVVPSLRRLDEALWARLSR